MLFIMRAVFGSCCQSIGDDPFLEIEVGVFLETGTAAVRTDFLVKVIHCFEFTLIGFNIIQIPDQFDREFKIVGSS